jgi:uncharacterized membrane protein YvlD (DUF360 family)
MFSLWITSQILPTLTVSGGWQAFLIAAVTFSVLMLLVAPVLRILFIPVNLLTFGLLSWVVNVVVLYLLTVFVTDVRINSWEYLGGNWQGFIIPQMTLKYPIALILSSFSLTFISNMLRSITDS